MPTQPKQPHPANSNVEQTIPYLGEHGLLMFEIPSDDERQMKLGMHIGRIDKMAFRELGRGTAEWENVIRLLVEAISFGLDGGKPKYGEERAAEAETLLQYYRHLPTQNRVWYLTGTLIGVALTTLLGLGIGTLLSSLTATPILTTVAVCTMAALGSVASVLSRLTSILSLQREHTRNAVMVGGASRPLIAALVAVGVFLLLQSEVVTIGTGGTAARNPPELKLLVAFLCGFSERFGRDLLGRFGASGAKDEESTPETGEAR